MSVAPCAPRIWVRWLSESETIALALVNGPTGHLPVARPSEFPRAAGNVVRPKHGGPKPDHIPGPVSNRLPLARSLALEIAADIVDGHDTQRACDETPGPMERKANTASTLIGMSECS